jgi:hypothetical protein
MRNYLQTFLIIFFSFTLSSCQHQSEKTTPIQTQQEVAAPSKQQNPKLYGAWKSDGPKEFKGYFYNYEYRFTLNRWELITTISADPVFKNIVLVFREEGLFETKPISSENFDVQFKTLKNYAKAVKRDPKIISLLGMGRCLNKFKVEIEVKPLSCWPSPSKEDCPLQYDHLVLKNQKIELSDRQLLERKCKANERASEVRLGLRKII